jgi:hypothetical protein
LPSPSYRQRRGNETHQNKETENVSTIPILPLGIQASSRNIDDLDGWIWDEEKKTYHKPGEEKNNDKQSTTGRKCECGVDTLGYGKHSDYCPKYGS